MLCSAVLVLAVGGAGCSCGPPPIDRTQMGTCQSDNGCQTQNTARTSREPSASVTTAFAHLDNATARNQTRPVKTRTSRCRLEAECAPDDPSSSSTSSSGAGGTGGSSGAAGAGGSAGGGGTGGGPKSDARATWPRTARRRWTEVRQGDMHRSEMRLRSTPMSRLRADRRRLQTYAIASATSWSWKDPSDVYDNGKQCTVSLSEQAAAHLALTEGLTCPKSGSGYCSGTECVQCVDSILITYCNNLVYARSASALRRIASTTCLILRPRPIPTAVDRVSPASPGSAALVELIASTGYALQR